MQLRQAVSQVLQGTVPLAQAAETNIATAASASDILLRSQSSHASLFSSSGAIPIQTNSSADAVRRNRAVTVLQSFVRGWLARKAVRKMCLEVLQTPPAAKYYLFLFMISYCCDSDCNLNHRLAPASAPFAITMHFRTNSGTNDIRLDLNAASQQQEQMKLFPATPMSAASGSPVPGSLLGMVSDVAASTSAASRRRSFAARRQSSVTMPDAQLNAQRMTVAVPSVTPVRPFIFSPHSGSVASFAGVMDRTPQQPEGL